MSDSEDSRMNDDGCPDYSSGDEIPEWNEECDCPQEDVDDFDGYNNRDW